MFKRIVTSEPVLITALVHAVITLVTAFGLSLTIQQIAAINMLTGAILALAARALVTPNKRVKAQVAEARRQEGEPAGAP